jgi:hypothetical protein
MRGIRVIIIAATTLCCSTALPQSPPADFDFKAAETKLESNDDFGKNLPNRVRKSLHELEQAPDGTRGYGVGAPMIRRVEIPDPPPPPFKTEREWATYHSYCAWDVIVKATHIDSTPVLSSDKTLIYTVSHFAVLDTIKSDVPFTPSQRLAVYQMGGEVEEAGDKLRVTALDSAPFEPQKNYLLTLRRDKNASVQQYFIPQRQTIAVTNDKMYPISGRTAWLSGMDAFPSGSTYAAIQKTFAEVHRLKSCADAR